MPQCRQQCGRWLHTISPSNRDYIWISEALLGNTLHSFVQTTKRHETSGSSRQLRTSSTFRRQACTGVVFGLGLSAQPNTEQHQEHPRKQQLVTGPQCRFASAIPGPLEARRRSSKRRNTSLAQSGHVPASVDSSVVFGPPGYIDWWDRGRSPTEEVPRQCE